MKLLIFLCLSLTLAASDVTAVEITKTEWMSKMTSAFPVYLCRSEQYFRRCFEISAQECEEAMTSAARVCLDKYDNDIPDVLAQPKMGTSWGSVVGQCVGETFEVAYIQKRKSDEICLDPSYWTK